MSKEPYMLQVCCRQILIHCWVHALFSTTKAKSKQYVDMPSDSVIKPITFGYLSNIGPACSDMQS